MAFRTILTNRGREIEADANANSTPIVLTHMAVGDGNGNPVTPDPAQTILARERYRDALNQLVQDPDDLVRFVAELVIPVSEGGFTIREVGLFTADGELFAIANVPDAYKPEASEGAYSDTVVRMAFVIENADVITLVIDPNVALATHTWVLNNVNAATVMPGGLTNQVWSKVSNADGDCEWRDPGSAIEVVVWSQEEIQTLAAAQVIVDLTQRTTDGMAAYIEGVRLRKDQFTINTTTRFTLTASYPAGTKISIVQNEETGSTDILRRPNNLSDVPDKAAARTNLDLPNWIAGVTIQWTQLAGIPAFASRWPTWTEVTSKPATFPPSAHTHAWADITSGVPDYATRWPTWTEVTGKPTTFTPAAHLHAISDVSGLTAALAAKYQEGSAPRFQDVYADRGDGTGVIFLNGAGTRYLIFDSTTYILPGAPLTVGGTVTAPAFAQSSSRRYKRDVKSISPREALRLLSSMRFTEYTMRADGSRAMGVIAEELADGPLDFAVIRTASGEPEAVNYQPLFVLACTALQGLADRLAELEAKA